MIHKKELTLKEFKELHSKRRSKTLTPFEKYKIMCTLKSPIEVLILAHLYTKFLHFDMKEFHQRKFDIQVGTSNYSENTITNNLNSLEKKGYFTSEFKTVQGKQYKRLHFNINLEKMNEFLTTGEELNPKNFSKLIETLRREIEDIKPNPYTKSIEVDNNDELDEKTTNPTKTIENNTATTEPAVEHIEPDEVTDEPINPNKEINKAQLLIENKDNPNLRPIFNDLRLSNDDIYYLYSSDYIVGNNKKMDSKKETLDIVINHKIKPIIREREMVY